PDVARPRHPQCRRARLHRSAGRALRAQARPRPEDVMTPEAAAAEETAARIAARVREAGGRALVIGGWVRDRLLGRPSKDVDLEVYRLPADRLRALLAEFGSVNTVG